MAASTRRSRRAISTPMISCRPTRRSCRRRRRATRSDGGGPREEGDVNAGTGELLRRLEQKAAPAHAALLVVDVQNDFVADGGFFAQVGADVKAIQRAIPRLV